MSSTVNKTSSNIKGVTVLSSENGTFSGADAIASIIFPGHTAITLGQVTTLTYSTYRETTPVRTLSRINVKGFARGQRTIAGTIIFTVFEKHIVNQLKEKIEYLSFIKKLKPCELPPFDIMLVFANEYGSSAKLFIYGVEVVDEGKVFSVEDMFTENTWSYIARDIELMDDIDGEYLPPQITLGNTESAGKYSVDDLVGDSDYLEMQEQLTELKKKQDAAVIAARKQAKDYVTTVEQITTEDTTIIINEPIPGGDWVYEIPDWMEPEEDIEVCEKLEFVALTNKDQIKAVNEDAGQRLFKLTFNLKDCGFGFDEQKILAGKTVSINYECFHKKDDGTPWSKNSFGDVTIPSKRASGKSSGEAEIYILCKNYTGAKHTVQPKVKFRLKDPKVYAKALVGNKTATWKATDTGWQQVSSTGHATEKYPMTFTYVLENSKDDKKATQTKTLKSRIKITARCKDLYSLPGRGTESNRQPVWMVAIKPKDIVLTNGPAVLDDIAVNGLVDNGYIHHCPPNFIHHVVYPSGKGYTDGIGLKNKDYLTPGFNLEVTLTDSNGKEVKNLSDYELRCEYKVTCQSKRIGTQTVTTQMALEGDSKLQKFLWYKGDKKISDWIQRPRFINLKLAAKELKTIEYLDNFYGINDIVDAVYRSFHQSNDKPLGRNTSIDPYLSYPSEMKKPEICQCRFKYDNISIELYNFRIVDKSTGTRVENTQYNICGNIDKAASIKFQMVSLDQAMLNYINGL